MSRASPDAEHAAAFLLARCQQEWRTIDALLSSPSRHCRPELPEVVQSLRRLCAVVVEDDELSPPDALGACTEYIVRQNVPNDLLGLCMADEPHGVLAELIRTLVIGFADFPHLFSQMSASSALSYKSCTSLCEANKHILILTSSSSYMLLHCVFTNSQMCYNYLYVLALTCRKTV